MSNHSSANSKLVSLLIMLLLSSVIIAIYSNEKYAMAIFPFFHTPNTLSQYSNPVIVIDIALENYSKYKITGNEDSKEVFLRNANWLVDNAVSHGNYSLLEYNFPWPKYNLAAPWYSALAQGRALQVLIRAHEITGDAKYLDTAKKLLNAFYIEVKNGGITYKTAKDGWWYESYAGVVGKHPHVLDGMMYSLLGLNDYLQYTHDLSAKYLFDQGMAALKINLPKYDYPRYFYSYYDIFHSTNNLTSHNVDVQLLERLYGISNEQLFKNYHDRWEDYKIAEIVDAFSPRIGISSGIPSVNYKSINGTQIGVQRNPFIVADIALENYSKYKITGNEDSKEVFLRNANWLVDNAVSHGNYSLLEYNFPWPKYNLAAPWYSALQGRALQVLIRAHEITGDAKYLDTAKKLLNAFYIEVKNGGITYKTAKDGWWYESYAGVVGKHPHVLDGMMYSLLGLNDYLQYTHDLSAKYLFDQGMAALKINLPKYENAGNYSKFSLIEPQDPLEYHKLNIKLLGILFDKTNDEVLRAYYLKWTNYTSPPYLHGQKCRINC